jgi:hypothetical protein
MIFNDCQSGMGTPNWAEATLAKNSPLQTSNPENVFMVKIVRQP